MSGTGRTGSLGGADLALYPGMVPLRAASREKGAAAPRRVGGSIRPRVRRRLGPRPDDRLVRVGDRPAGVA
jgi:hypothetical protein